LGFITPSGEVKKGGKTSPSGKGNHRNEESPSRNSIISLRKLPTHSDLKKEKPKKKERHFMAAGAEVPAAEYV